MSDFDLRVISLGAGVQSTALYLMVCEGLLEPRPDFAIFADTQIERAATYEYLAKLEEMGDIPILRATAGNLAEDALHSMRNTPSRFLPIPAYSNSDKQGMGRRQCTRSHKLEVIYQEVRRQLGLSPGEVGAGKYNVEMWIGISTDEAKRAKMSRYPILHYYWPLLCDVPMSRVDCLKWLASRGVPRPVKSSCWLCPFKSDLDWIELRRDDPAAWAQAVEFDRQIQAEGHALHCSLKPLDEATLDPSRQLDLFGQDCEGMCAV